MRRDESYSHAIEMETFESLPKKLQDYFKTYPVWPDAQFIKEMYERFGSVEVTIEKFKALTRI